MENQAAIKKVQEAMLYRKMANLAPAQETDLYIGNSLCCFVFC